MATPQNLIGQLWEFGERADAHQRAFAQRMVDLATLNPRATERSTFPAHFTASALITEPSRKRVLLTLHRKLGKWLQLGGHADGSWDLASAALKEAQEESGLERFLWPLGDKPVDLDIHTIPAHGSEPEHLHFDVRFVLEAQDPQLIVVSSESRDLKWLSWEQAHQLASEPALRRLLNRFRGALAVGVLLLSLVGCGITEGTDPAFAGGKGVLRVNLSGDDALTGMVVTSDGKILAGGRSKRDTYDFSLTRLDSEGSVDTTFGEKGYAYADLGGEDSGKALLVRPTGEILMVGESETGGATRLVLAQWRGDGSLDSTFGSAGTVTLSTHGPWAVGSAVLDGGGALTVAATAQGSRGREAVLVRFRPDGSLDTRFQGGGFSFLAPSPQGDSGRALAQRSSGHLILGGSARRGDQGDLLLGFFRSTGERDLQVGVGGKTTLNIDELRPGEVEGSSEDGIEALLLLKGDNLIWLGSSQFQGQGRGIVVRSRTTGYLDSSFGRDGVTTLAEAGKNLAATAAAPLSGDRLLVGGTRSEGERGTVFLARLDSQGKLDPTFGASGYLGLDLPTPSGSPIRMVDQGQGRTLVGGTVKDGKEEGDFWVTRLLP